MIARWANDEGSMATESALIGGFLIGFVAIIAYATIVTSAGGNVADAAAEGARAAAQASDSGAYAAAQAAVNSSLEGWCVSTPGVAVTPKSDIGSSGAFQLAVTVTCTVDLSVVGATIVPGSRTYVETRAAVVDRYRGDG